MNTPWRSQVLCRVSDVQARLASISFVVNMTEGASLEPIIQRKIDLGKDMIRQDLLSIFEVKMPGRVQQFIDKKNALIQQQLQNIYRTNNILSQTTGIPVNGVFNLSNTDVDLLFYLLYWPITKPKFFSFYGQPTIGVGGSYDSQATCGDMLLDTSGYQIYINRGNTPATPHVDWHTYDVVDAMDNILNVSELKNVAVDKTVHLLAEDGWLRNVTQTVNSDTFGVRADIVSYWEKQYRQRLLSVFPILKVNFNASGFMSDDDRSITNETRAYFGV